VAQRLLWFYGWLVPLLVPECQACLQETASKKATSDLMESNAKLTDQV